MNYAVHGEWFNGLDMVLFEKVGCEAECNLQNEIICRPYRSTAVPSGLNIRKVFHQI